MWFLLLLTHLFVHIELGNLQSKGRTILRNQNDKTRPCEGIVEVYYNGTPGYVGDKFWDEKTEAVVCSITHCGTWNKSEDEYRYTDQKVWLNELKCDGKEESLWECPGWPAPGLSFYLKPTVKKVTCSNNITLSLTKHKCAGAVQYNTGQDTGYLCGDNWDGKDAELLCQSLGCGGYTEVSNLEWITPNDFHQLSKMNINCSGIDPIDHLWQCVTGKSSTCKRPASVVCKAYQRVQLKGDESNRCSGLLEIEKDGMWKPAENSNSSDNNAETLCQRMHCGGAGSVVENINNSLKITCTDKVEVVLMNTNQESKCYGSVNIRVNGKYNPVCASTWTEKEAEMVCQELKCGKMVSTSKSRADWGIMDFVKCTGNESSLWHCNAKHDKRITCSNTPYVTCAASLDVKLVDGPGRCAGRLEIFHEDKWKRVSRQNFQGQYSDLVCKKLKCGSTRSIVNKKFHQGSNPFMRLDCPSNPKDMSDCRYHNGNSNDKEAVGIICDEHELVFLYGNQSCSGTVMIEKETNSYWLSGSSETWNQESANTVCQQMHCGSAINYTSAPEDNTKDVWHKSYKCLSTKTSLFECDNYTSLQSVHNQTIAYVECSGTINMNLSNNCWGTVNICADQCGGVCDDTWTDEMSTKLCKSLDCGAPVSPVIRQEQSSIQFMSFHTPETRMPSDLTLSSFVKKNSIDGTCRPAYVVCTGSIKPRFSSSRDKCSGNIEVNYEGHWFPLSSEALKDTKTQNTICKELECGSAVKLIPYFGPTSKVDHVVTSLQCPRNANSLAACSISVQTQKNNLTGLQCSDWRTIALEVQDTCKGNVVVYSKQQRSVMVSQSWNKSEGERLCKDMNCGRFSKEYYTQKPSGLPPWTKTFSCPAQKKLGSIWDCEAERSAKDTEKPNQKLYVECEEKAKVTLSEKCRGNVMIDQTEICSQNWNKGYADRVCQEMNCSNAFIEKESGKSADRRKKYLHVSCDKHHYKLDQCKRFEETCDKELVSISCIGNVKFKTLETCGGEIQVNYQNKWENVCNEEFSEDLKNMLCREINCFSSIKRPSGLTPAKFLRQPTQTRLACPSDCNDIRYCVQPKSCSDRKPATIYCEGYKIPAPTQPPQTSTPVMPIVVGVGLVLVLVIFIVVFVRFYLARRAQRTIPPEMLPDEDMEFESGNYEHINSSDEMEQLGHGKFQPEAEFIREKDVQSTSSLPYDDIDEVAESQPLTPQGSIAASPRDNMHIVLNQNGVNYEVDESLDNYDDIDACREVSQTAVEVHDGPRTTPESDAAVPTDPVQKDEDYLVPGQDGCDDMS